MRSAFQILSLVLSVFMEQDSRCVCVGGGRFEPNLSRADPGKPWQHPIQDLVLNNAFKCTQAGGCTTFMEICLLRITLQIITHPCT